MSCLYLFTGDRYRRIYHFSLFSVNYLRIIWLVKISKAHIELKNIFGSIKLKQMGYRKYHSDVNLDRTVLIDFTN